MTDEGIWRSMPKCALTQEELDMLKASLSFAIFLERAFPVGIDPASKSV